MATVTKAASSNTLVSTGWTNPTNAYGTTADGTFATAAPAKNGTVSSDYGFPAFTTSDIPDGSSISSVVVTVAWKLSATTLATLGVQGRNNGVTDSAAEVTDTTDTAVTQKTFTFGTVPALTDLRNAGQVVARVRDSRGNTNTAHTGSLDFVSLTVTYSTPTSVSDTASASVADAASSLTASASDTEAPSASETDTISGSVSDSQPVALADSTAVSSSLSATDSGSMTESATVATPISGSDSASASDSALLAASVAASDAQTAAEAASIGVSSVETGSATDFATLSAAVSGSDSGAGVDSGSVSSSGSTQNVSDTDGIRVADVAALAGALAAVEAGTATDAQQLAAAVAVADVLAEAEAVTLAAALSGNDSDTLVESGVAGPSVLSTPGSAVAKAIKKTAATLARSTYWKSSVQAGRTGTVKVDDK